MVCVFFFFSTHVEYVLLLFLLADTEGCKKEKWKEVPYLIWDMALKKSFLLNGIVMKVLGIFHNYSMN